MRRVVCSKSRVLIPIILFCVFGAMILLLSWPMIAGAEEGAAMDGVASNQKF